MIVHGPTVTSLARLAPLPAGLATRRQAFALDDRHLPIVDENRRWPATLHSVWRHETAARSVASALRKCLLGTAASQPRRRSLEPLVSARTQQIRRDWRCRVTYHEWTYPDEVRGLARRPSANRPTGTVAMPALDEREYSAMSGSADPPHEPQTYGGAVVGPERAKFVKAMVRASDLADVAAGIAEAAKNTSVFYVERVDGGWRWSLAHRGGAYPLLRVAARFLGVDHTRLVVGFRTIDGCAVASLDPYLAVQPNEWTLIEVDHPVSADEVELRILRKLRSA